MGLRRWIAPAWLVASVLAQAPAHALGLVPLAQDRLVESSTVVWDFRLPECGLPGQPDCNDGAFASATAPDFGPFSAAAEPSCLLLDCPESFARQESTIAALAIEASGEALATAFASEDGTLSGASTSYGRLSIVFRIDEPAPFEASALLALESGSHGASLVHAQLVGPAALPIFVVSCESAEPGPPCGVADEWSGVLEPGDYELFVHARSEAALADPSQDPVTDRATFAVTLRLVPEPATGALLVPALAVVALARRRSGVGAS